MFDQITLPNGLRVVGEKLGHIHSCTVGVWVKVGSVNELPEENGLSHFIEHMVFKGTENRTARQIAEEMDMVGGQLNAFTSKECTCFYAKVIDEDLRLAVDILSDLALRPTFDEKELNKERGVVLEAGSGQDPPCRTYGFPHEPHRACRALPSPFRPDLAGNPRHGCGQPDQIQ